MLDAIQSVFNAFGAIVFVPVILFIVAKCMGVQTKKAVDCAILSAVGLDGFTLIINSYSGIISPIIEQMVETTGVSLQIVDIGWQATSVVAYSTTIGIIFFAIAVILQLALYFLKFTNVFMVSDLWNNYGFMVWGSMLYLLTKNIFLAFLLMIVQNLYCLLFSEVLAKRFSTYYGYPNCCMSVPMHMDAVPFAIVMNFILNKLGLNKVNASPKALSKKAGMLADPKVIGLILGAIIAIISYSHSLGELSSWGAIATCAIATSAVMTIFPKVAGIFASAFTPLSSAYAKKAAESGKGRSWYIAINDAVAYGETATLTTGIILMPIILVIAFILPGNKFLPLVDLCAIPYMIEVFICVTDGNMVKSTICGTIWYTIGLLCITAVAPYFTSVAASVGVEMALAGTLVASFGVMGRPLNCLSFLAFLSGNPIIIGAVIALYVVLYVGFKFKGQALIDYMETCNAVPQPKVEEA